LYEQAVAEKDALEEELASVDAELDGIHRKTLNENKGKERLTEAVVHNAVQLDNDHKEAFDRYLAAKTKVGVLGALKDAFKQRGYMLRDLASLIVSANFEQTSIQGNAQTDEVVYRAQRERLAAGRRDRRNESQT